MSHMTETTETLTGVGYTLHKIYWLPVWIPISVANACTIFLTLLSRGKKCISLNLP